MSKNKTITFKIKSNNNESFETVQSGDGKLAQSKVMGNLMKNFRLDTNEAAMLSSFCYIPTMNSKALTKEYEPILNEEFYGIMIYAKYHD